MKRALVMKDHYDANKSRSSRTMVTVMLAFIIGLLLGVIFHDTLIQHLPDRSNIKSWYPR